MSQVSVIEAKNNLSALLRKLELGQEDEIVVARHHKPVARLTLCEEKEKKVNLGMFDDCESFYSDDWDSEEVNDEIARMFGADR